MNDLNHVIQYDLMCVIVSHGKGSKILRVARQNGVKGGTVILGKGTIKNKLLNWLDLDQDEREIVLMVVDCSIVSQAILALDEKFHFKKPNHGIVFTMPLTVFFGDQQYEYEKMCLDKGDNKMIYDAIFVIVDKGHGEHVVEAGLEAGSKGGTIINARGAGIHETSKLFNMEIEPEKEIVLILTESKYTKNIVLNIKEKMNLDAPGNGILFVQQVKEAHGLYKQQE